MNLEQLVKMLSEYLDQYSKSRVTFEIKCGKGKSVLIWSVYPEVYDDGSEPYIVISNIG
jgi:hypothetical protein